MNDKELIRFLLDVVKAKDEHIMMLRTGEPLLKNTISILKEFRRRGIFERPDGTWSIGN